MKKFVILIFLGLLTIGVNSQTSEKWPFSVFNNVKLMRANSLFKNMAYARAASRYEELVSVQFKLEQVFPKLGDCYHNLGNTEKTEVYYYYAVTVDSMIKPEYYYKYAQALRSNGKYSESEIWMDKYREFSKSDTRVASFEENKGTIDKLLDEQNFYEVSERKNLNSVYADFGAVPLNDKIVFSSGRTDKLMVNDKYSWNDKAFLDLYVYDTSSLAKKHISLYSKKLNTRFHEGPFCFADDNKTIYFTRDGDAQGSTGITHLMIYRAIKLNGEWANIEPLPFNSKEYSVGHPSVSPDGKRLYFASNMPGTIGKSDIYYVEIDGNTYGAPVNLGKEINTEGNEMFPFITEKGLYFSSDGIAGFGGLDIFFARLKPDGTFDKPVNLGMPLNSPKDDFSYYLNADNRTGYFASNRPGGTGDDDIYEFSINTLVLKGELRDSTNENKVLGNVEVTLQSPDSTLVRKTISDSIGRYSFNIGYGRKYMLKASKPGYVTGTREFSTQGEYKPEITQNIKLGLARPFILFGKITDRKTGELLSDVELTIIDSVKQTLIIDSRTGPEGAFKKQLEKVHMNSHMAYRVMLRKAGYLAKTLVFDHYINEYDIDMNQYLEISLDKIKVGVDIGKLLNINPIYFDLGKWDIRPDAAYELDKIVQAMKDNPTVVIELGSHTDSRGTAKANLDLSDQRAKASAEYIISQGIDPNRIYGKGYGETRLINRCRDGVKCSEEEHAQNRRTEFKVVKM